MVLVSFRQPASWARVRIAVIYACVSHARFRLWFFDFFSTRLKSRNSTMYRGHDTRQWRPKKVSPTRTLITRARTHVLKSKVQRIVVSIVPREYGRVFVYGTHIIYDDSRWSQNVPMTENYICYIGMSWVYRVSHGGFAHRARSVILFSRQFVCKLF